MAKSYLSNKKCSLIGLITLLVLSFFGSERIIASVTVNEKRNKFVLLSSNKDNIQSSSYNPYCPAFANQKHIYDATLEDVPKYKAEITPSDRKRILEGDFPSTRFTPHVNSILQSIDLNRIQEDCKWIYYFTVSKRFSKPESIFCTGQKSSRQVNWWCKIFHELFSSTRSFPPVLPSNVTLGISTDDFTTFPPFTCLANSSPNGTFSITNFLELQRMTDQTIYPILNFSQRCPTPIWRGSAWREPGPLIPQNDSNILQSVFKKSRRLQAVFFSNQHPNKLDAKISDPRNGFLREDKFWRNNSTNGLNQLLPLHAIPQEEYYTQFQTVLVLCGRGAAFRTPVHFSTATAVVLQDCPYKEWYHSLLQPWKHYIPMDDQLKNLSEAMQWVQMNPLLVKEIASQGRQFYEEYLSFERNYEHFHELLYRLSIFMSENNIAHEPPAMIGHM
jgi:hypothetical protein